MPPDRRMREIWQAGVDLNQLLARARSCASSSGARTPPAPRDAFGGRSVTSRWIMPDDGSAWANLFESFRASAFRLEGMQTYDAPGEADAVARFVAGEAHEADTSWWTSMVRSRRAAGCTMTRVRVITEPITDYTRFELAVYPDLVAAGDEVRVIHVPDESRPRTSGCSTMSSYGACTTPTMGRMSAPSSSATHWRSNSIDDGAPLPLGDQYHSTPISRTGRSPKTVEPSTRGGSAF